LTARENVREEFWPAPYIARGSFGFFRGDERCRVHRSHRRGSLTEVVCPTKSGGPIHVHISQGGAMQAPMIMSQQNWCCRSVAPESMNG
jgi:hypothetical protein